MYSPYTATHEMYGNGPYGYGHHPHHSQYQHSVAATAPRNGLQLPQGAFPTPQQQQHFSSNTPMQRQRTPNNMHTTPAAAGRTIAAGGSGWYQQHSQNPLQQYPTPTSTASHGHSTFQKGGWASQHHHYQQQHNASISPVANVAQQLQYHQHGGSGVVSAATAATATSLADKICPMSGKGLERELMCASKEELVQVLLDLCSCNVAASTFIQSKAQLFALQATHVGYTDEISVVITPPAVTMSVGAAAGRTYSAAAPHTAAAPSTATAAAAATAGNESQELTTPSKELFSLDDSNASWHSRFSSAAAKELSTTESPFAAAAPHQHQLALGKTPVRRELQERHITPETRPFSAEVHPCLRLYGACRHSVNCIFKTLPRNLCLHWIRGSCAGGADCGCVHRFPVNCPEQVRTVYELSHGGDRTEVAKRAESTAEKARVLVASATAAAAAAASSMSGAAAEIGTMGTPVNPRQRSVVHAEKLVLSPIPYTMDEDDIESAVTPRNESQRISTLMTKAAASSGQDNLTAAREAHQLMEATGAAADGSSDSPTMVSVERCLRDSFDAAMDDVMIADA
jgi:hypothetical protein